ncbi:MAG: response regulator transcription factor, partial [Halobacteriaceae archaeon]
DGQSALAQLDESIDIALLDRRMPNLTGDEVLAQVRDRDLDVQVAMVTAVDPDFDVIKMGFDDYVVKPVTKSDLFDLVDAAVFSTCVEESNA